MDRMAKLKSIDRERARVETQDSALKKEIDQITEAIDNCEQRRLEKARANLIKQRSELGDEFQRFKDNAESELRADAAGLIESARDKFFEIRDQAKKLIDPRDGDGGGRARFDAAVAAHTALAEVALSADPAKAIQRLEESIPPANRSGRERPEPRIENGGVLLVGS